MWLDLSENIIFNNISGIPKSLPSQYFDLSCMIAKYIVMYRTRMKEELGLRWLPDELKQLYPILSCNVYFTKCYMIN